MAPSPYEVLGVAASAALEEVRRAFKRCALATHPDKGGTKEAFRQVLDAFELVMDPERRANCDRRLATCRSAARGKRRCPEADAPNFGCTRRSKRQPPPPPEPPAPPPASSPAPSPGHRSAASGPKDSCPKPPVQTLPVAPTAPPQQPRSRPPQAAGEPAPPAAPTPSRSRACQPSALARCAEVPLEEGAAATTAESRPQAAPRAGPCPGAPGLRAEALDGLLRRLYRLLQGLPADRKRAVFTEHFTQNERLTLEHWILSRRTAAEEGGREVRPAPQQGTTELVESTALEGWSSSGCSTEDGEGSSSDSDAAAAGIEDVAPLMDVDRWGGEQRQELLLAICDADAELAGEGPADDGAPGEDEVAGVAGELSDECAGEARQAGERSCSSEGESGCQSDGTDAELPPAGEDHEGEEVAEASQVPRARGRLRGICTKGCHRGYYALVTIGMCWLRTGERKQLARVVDFHVALMDLKRRWTALGRQALESELYGTARATFQEHGIDPEQEMDLRIRVRVPVRTWITKPEQVSTPELRLAPGINAWCRLRRVRSQFRRTGFGFSTEVCDPYTLASTWEKFLDMYFEVMAENGKGSAAAREELMERWQANRPQAERKCEAWNRFSMAREERLQLAVARCERWGRRCQARELRRQQSLEERCQRWNCQAMLREERLQRALVGRERRHEARERRAMRREESAVRRSLRLALRLGRVQLRPEERIQRLLRRWRRLEADHRRRALRAARREALERHAQHRAALLKRRREERAALLAARAERLECRRRQAEREARWRHMNRRDITMAELLGGHGAGSS